MRAGPHFRPEGRRFRFPSALLLPILVFVTATPGRVAAQGAVDVTVTPEKAEWAVHLSRTQTVARFHTEALGTCIRGRLDILFVAAMEAQTWEAFAKADEPLQPGPAHSFLPEGAWDPDKDEMFAELTRRARAEAEALAQDPHGPAKVWQKYGRVASYYAGVKGILLSRDLDPAEFWSRPSQLKAAGTRVLVPAPGSTEKLDLFCYTPAELARAKTAVVAWAENVMRLYRQNLNARVPDSASPGPDRITAFETAIDRAGVPEAISDINPRTYTLIASRAGYPLMTVPDACAPCSDLAAALNAQAEHMRTVPSPPDVPVPAPATGNPLARYNSLMTRYRSCLEANACVRTQDLFARQLAEAEKPVDAAEDAGRKAGPSEERQTPPAIAMSRLPDRIVTGSGRRTLPAAGDRCVDDAMRRRVAEKCAEIDESSLEVERATLARKLNELVDLYDEGSDNADKRRYLADRWREGYARYRALEAQIAQTRAKADACIRQALEEARDACAKTAEAKKEAGGGDRDLRLSGLSRDGQFAYAILENRGSTALTDIHLELMFLKGDAPVGRSTAVSSIPGINPIVAPPGARIPISFSMDRKLPAEGDLRYGMRWKARIAQKWTAVPRVENLQTRFSWGYGVYIYVSFDLVNATAEQLTSGLCFLGLLDPDGDVLAAGDTYCEAELAPGERKSFRTIMHSGLLDSLEAEEMEVTRARAAQLKPVVFVAPVAIRSP